ncbi:LptA/OstA family protein [Deinococcus navajonensis]|uniref:LptA/OstA family protein n=1 Tax=Deinococcus navajonensis TaxID=309884 RepID=A0ABV8XLK8_9DEIO
MRLPAALLTLGLLLLPATQAQQGPTAPPAPASPSAPRAAEPPVSEETAGCVEGQETSCTELVRTGDDGKERRITIVRTGTSDETGIDAVCGPREGEPEGTPTLLVLSESGPRGIEIRIDKNLIRVPLAIVTQKDGGEGRKSDGRIQASAGSARILDEVPEGATERLALCGVEATPKPVPDTVLVTQGRTQLKGQALVYDEADGVARIDGPITFARENGTESLSGQSQRIEVNVDAETTTLVGAVTLNSAGGRVSRAARVEYDDARNLARLIGTPEQPAESIRGGDKLTAGMILYDLDRNEVYAVKAEGGTITGEFVEETTPAPTTPTSSSTPPVQTPQQP